MQQSFDALEKRIGYHFKDSSLLTTALTHASYVNEHRNQDVTLSSYERLEYLGDAVLQFVISAELYATFPDCAEGYLTQFRQHLVREETLARVAESIRLYDFILLGKGESGASKRPGLLSDCLEALFAAVYLDGKDAVKDVILRLMHDEFETCRVLRGGDYKTRMIQLVQGDGEDILSYEVIREEGPPHDRTFFVVAQLNSNIVGRGTGKSKREAEQNAAKEALALFGILGT
jgi:ribonuclease-3